MKSKKHGKKNMANQNKTVHIRWRKLNNRYLITNDFGYYVIVDKNSFKKIISNKIHQKTPLYRELVLKGFISDNLDFDNIFSRWKNSNSYLFNGPSLHILVTTLRCNHKCIYCQSQAVDPKNKETDMSLEVAKKAIDIAFTSTSPIISFEFQGGEPLYNWDVVKKTIEHIRNKEKENEKTVNLSVVTNFSLMDEKKAKFLIENEVSICTSLDGPEKLHNKNRIYTNANSYTTTIRWLKYFNKLEKKQKGPGYRIFKPSALSTISAYSLDYPKQIIDEYIKNGLDTIFLRPLSPIGFAKKLWNTIGYDANSFLKFYKTSFKYIIELNKKGINIKEKTAQMIINKIINGRDSGFVDLRCPCGAAIGQIAYNYDGDIYTCDEARMLGWEGDDFFKIGNINDSYKKLINSQISKICGICSNLENQIQCFRCAYKPYCGVCPVINYETQKNIWGNNIISDRCKIFMGIFDTIFELLIDKKNYKIFEKWTLVK